ncbi:MAG: hypothetical protein HY654_05745, partial [Acidobacteria bacterium]|nr:hypothetical protein [Acidobacteriota bacterium]
QALFFGTREQIEQLRPMSAPINRFQFGAQVVSTRVFTMIPRAVAAREPWMDVTAAMDERPRERAVTLKVLPVESTLRPAEPDTGGDPFAEIAI